MRKENSLKISLQSAKSDSFITLLKRIQQDRKEKDPKFDSKYFLHQELHNRVGPQRTSEILTYVSIVTLVISLIFLKMQKMSRQRQGLPSQPNPQPGPGNQLPRPPLQVHVSFVTCVLISHFLSPPR